MAKKNAKKDPFKEVVDKLLPSAKKEFEKGLASAKKAIIKGEEYLKELSIKGAKETKKITLTLKKEKAYYNLGKLVASTAVEKWQESKAIAALLRDIQSSNKQIKKLK